MGFHREHVVWQSPDGTWGNGRFAVDYYACGQDDDCDNAPEHEWCAEFDQNDFDWASTGHPTMAAADDSWDGSNPGGHSSYSYDPSNATTIEWIEHYDDMAAKQCEYAQQARARSQSQGGGRFYYSSLGNDYGYQGPARQRTLKAIASERNELEHKWYGHQLGGYDNLVDPRVEELGAQIVERLKSATAEEKRDYLHTQKARRDALEEQLSSHRERRRVDALRRRPYGSHYYDPDFARRERALSERETSLEGFIAKIDVKRASQAQEFFPPAPVVKKPAPTKKPAARAKTTTKSTAGSFATKARAEAPEVALPTPSAPVIDDLWDDVPKR